MRKLCVSKYAIDAIACRAPDRAQRCVRLGHNGHVASRKYLKLWLCVVVQYAIEGAIKPVVDVIVNALRPWCSGFFWAVARFNGSNLPWGVTTYTFLS